jgi:hypothetical protein
MAQQAQALEAVRALNERDELKGGWTRVVLPDGTYGRRAHWSFVDDDELVSASSLVEALAAFRFEAALTPDGDILGVSLAGCHRSQGDERHLWATLAPFVEPGGELLWHGEDDRIWRWTFDGRAMHEQAGRIVFDHG